MSYKQNERNELMKKLRAEGRTYEEIGTMFNLTRQRVHQLITGYNPYHPLSTGNTLDSKDTGGVSSEHGQRTNGGDGLVDS